MNNQASRKLYAVENSMADNEPKNKNKMSNDPTNMINNIKNTQENSEKDSKLSARDELQSAKSNPSHEVSLSSLHSTDFIANARIQEYEYRPKKVEFQLKGLDNGTAVKYFNADVIVDENDECDVVKEHRKKRDGYFITAPRKARSEPFFTQAGPSSLQALAKRCSLVIFGKEKLHGLLHAHLLGCAKSENCSETNTGFSAGWHHFMERQKYLMNLELDDNDDAPPTDPFKNDAKRKEEYAVDLSTGLTIDSSTENEIEKDEEKSDTVNEPKGFLFLSPRQTYLMNLELDVDNDNAAATDKFKNEKECKEEFPVKKSSTEKKGEQQNYETGNERKGLFFMSPWQMYLMEQEINAVKDELAASQRSLTTIKKENERRASESIATVEHEQKERSSISQMASVALQTVARRRRIIREELFSDDDLPSWYDIR